MPNRSNSDIHRRRSMRLRGYDYAQIGAYFVTICTMQRMCLFGEIGDGAMRLNDAGRIVEAEWLRTPTVRANVMLDAFVVMPNHVHGIVVIGDGRTGTPTACPYTDRQFGGAIAGSLATIIGQFKSIVTKRINRLHNTQGMQIWQRNYYEHIIRDNADLDRIREYIANNPSRWTLDRLHPDNTPEPP